VSSCTKSAAISPATAGSLSSSSEDYFFSTGSAISGIKFVDPYGFGSSSFFSDF
jgi:hypothetical protein